jgi:hypothetical protein
MCFDCGWAGVEDTRFQGVLAEGGCVRYELWADKLPRCFPEVDSEVEPQGGCHEVMLGALLIGPSIEPKT